MESFDKAANTIAQHEYNTAGWTFNIDKKRPLERLLEEGKEICGGPQKPPIQCIEGCFVAMHMTQGATTVVRFPISIESHYEPTPSELAAEECGGRIRRVYHHLVLGVLVQDNFGALGISRNPELMTKRPAYPTLTGLIRSFIAGYKQDRHRVMRLKFGAPIPHHNPTMEVCWEYRYVYLRPDDDGWEREVELVEARLRQSNRSKSTERPRSASSRPTPPARAFSMDRSKAGMNNSGPRTPRVEAVASTTNVTPQRGRSTVVKRLNRPTTPQRVDDIASPQGATPSKAPHPHPPTPTQRPRASFASGPSMSPTTLASQPDMCVVGKPPPSPARAGAVTPRRASGSPAADKRTPTRPLSASRRTPSPGRAGRLVTMGHSPLRSTALAEPTLVVHGDKAHSQQPKVKPPLSPSKPVAALSRR